MKALTDLDVEPCVLAIEQAIAALTGPQGRAVVHAGHGEGGGGEGCGEGSSFSSNACTSSSLTSSSLPPSSLTPSSLLTEAPRFLSLFAEDDGGSGVGLVSVGWGGGVAVNVAAELEWHKVIYTHSHKSNDARTNGRTNTRTHARKHTRTHARMHACTHARTHARS